MTWRTRTRILLAASTGAALVAACSGNSSTDGTVSSSPVQSDAGSDAFASGNESDADAGSSACRPFSLTECSPGQAAAIAQALDRSEIDAANLALGRSSDPDTIAFAKMMIQDHTNLESQLNAWLEASSTQPVSNDIAEHITMTSASQLSILGQSTQFDRDYAAAQVADHVTALGFFEHVLPPPPSEQDAGADAAPGSIAALAQLVMQGQTTIRNHLEMAFALERRVVGVCGTPTGGSSSQGGGQDAGATNDAAADARTNDAATADAAATGDASDASAIDATGDGEADAFMR
ncbi:MAG TPA: DUF4142 domain-containing protein [Polyangiaceae bacterium]|nr:DUF4142 domain-containing protein [Polyangiaceae bacterium]